MKRLDEQPNNAPILVLGCAPEPLSGSGSLPGAFGRSNVLRNSETEVSVSE